MEEQKQTLVEIVSQVAEVTSQIVEAGGELSPELEMKLMQIDLSLARKVDGYSNFIDRLEMEIAYWDAKAKRMKQIADSHKRLREGLRTRIKEAMIAMDRNEIAGEDMRFKLVRSTPSLVIDDENAIPGEYQIVSWEIDNAKLKKALQSDMKVPGAHLEESLSLRALSKKKE
jgi:hypothetical protein